MTFITQAIETKYMGPTNTRGSRIKATAAAGSIMVPFDYQLNPDGNHKAAADALIAAVNAPGFGSPNRAKPDTIRATAAWALTQLPKNPEVDRMVEKLKQDRSDYVRKAAELSEIFRE